MTFVIAQANADQIMQVSDRRLFPFLQCGHAPAAVGWAIRVLGFSRRSVERRMRTASPLGVYAEAYDPETGRHPGELPTGVLPSRADRGCGAHDLPRGARGALTMDAYDAIITRTGAGGDALARQVAPLGKRVLLRGDWLLRELPVAAACLSGHIGAEQ
jgi:hypothetical protein